MLVSIANRGRLLRCPTLRIAVPVLAVTAVALLLPAAASAADSLYWTDITSGEIRVANLDGTGSPRTLYGGEIAPEGIAIDPAAGKIYWAASKPNCFGDCGLVRVGNLDGSATPQTLFGGSEFIPGGQGLVTDPAAGKVYWAGGGAISVGNIDGTGDPRILYSETTVPPSQVGDARGLAIDPAGGRIFWANHVGAGEIRTASLSGEPETDHSLFTSENEPWGLALDPAAQKLFWSTSTVPGAIRSGNADGTGIAQDLFASENNPFGVALDPTTGKIYWASGTESIRVGNLNGTGSAQPLFTDGGSPQFVALLRSPAGTGAPSISGAGQAGQVLSCGTGGWASDMPSALLYRSPRTFSFQWLKDGAPVAGANSSTYTPTSGGSYSCRVIASNEAGSGSQTSASLVVAPAGAQAFGRKTLVSLALLSSRVSSSGLFKVTVKNGNGFAVSGKLSGRTPKKVSGQRPVKLKPKPFRVGAHAKTTVRLKLPGVLRSLLDRQGKLRLLLTAKLKDPAGNVREVRALVTLKPTKSAP